MAWLLENSSWIGFLRFLNTLDFNASSFVPIHCTGGRRLLHAVFAFPFQIPFYVDTALAIW